MKIVELEQNTPAWLDWRKTKRMASEASVVTGRNPWQKPLHLAQVKRGVSSVFMNSAMARGHQYEPEARAYLEAKLGLIGDPVVIETGDFGASLDWWCKDDQRSIIGEIKIPSSPEAKLWTEGVVPEYYMDQVQQQLAVSGAEVCYFLIYLPEAQEGKFFEIYPDAKRWNEIQQAWRVFWETYMVGDLPQEEERHDPEWFEVCELYRVAKSELDRAQTKLDEYKQELIELAGKQSAKGCGIQLIKSEREGSVSWSKLAKELTIDPALIKKYTGKASTVWTVKVD